VEGEIVHSMLMDGDSEHLLDIAKSERESGHSQGGDSHPRMTGGGHDGNAWWSFTAKESDPSIKRDLIQDCSCNRTPGA